jgi:hypothetical protein
MAVGSIGAYRQCAVAAQQIDCLMEDSCLDGWNGVRISSRCTTGGLQGGDYRIETDSTWKEMVRFDDSILESLMYSKSPLYAIF